MLGYSIVEIVKANGKESVWNTRLNIDIKLLFNVRVETRRPVKLQQKLIPILEVV